MQKPKSLYIHVPFCRHRCGYCNFTLVAGRDHLIENYLEAISIELSRVPPASLETVFVGGGTPTHLSIPHLERLFDLIEQKFELLPELELTVEGNPRHFDSELVDYLASRRVNRISLGVQSFQERKLELLERDHNRKLVFEVVDLIRKRIPNFSIDLIFGVQGETTHEWENDLKSVIECDPTHVSTYSLTVEKGTRFWNEENRNRKMQVDEEAAADLYEQGIDYLNSAGLFQYEVSNFSKPTFQCSHNVNYWNGEEYFGLGPGAARYINRVRATNHQSTTRYIKLLLNDQDPTLESEVIDDEQRLREILIFGLRQLRGIDLDEFEKRTGKQLLSFFKTEVSTLLQQGFLTLEDGSIRLTRPGLLVSDSIWPQFV